MRGRTTPRLRFGGGLKIRREGSAFQAARDWAGGFIERNDGRNSAKPILSSASASCDSRENFSLDKRAAKTVKPSYFDSKRNQCC